MLKWTFSCDGHGCAESAAVEPLRSPPPGWLVRTTIDRVESLDEGATGTGFPGGRSELERIRHFCASCRRKVAGT